MLSCRSNYCMFSCRSNHSTLHAEASTARCHVLSKQLLHHVLSCPVEATTPPCRNNFTPSCLVEATLLHPVHCRNDHFIRKPPKLYPTHTTLPPDAVTYNSVRHIASVKLHKGSSAGGRGVLGGAGHPTLQRHPILQEHGVTFLEGSGVFGAVCGVCVWEYQSRWGHNSFLLPSSLDSLEMSWCSSLCVSPPPSSPSSHTSLHFFADWDFSPLQAYLYAPAHHQGHVLNLLSKFPHSL